mgnify:CR=1 FL=1
MERLNDSAVRVHPVALTLAVDASPEVPVPRGLQAEPLRLGSLCADEAPLASDPDSRLDQHTVLRVEAKLLEAHPIKMPSRFRLGRHSVTRKVAYVILVPSVQWCLWRGHIDNIQPLTTLCN